MSDEIKVKTASDYLKKKKFTKKQIEKEFENNFNKCKLISQILSTQIGYYCMRRDTIASGIPCEEMVSLTTKLIEEFNTKYPHELFIDFNEDVDY